MCGVLYVVATPIGNLQDLSRRAENVLAQVELVLCEDTRHTGRLLHHLGLEKKTLSYHEHNEESRIPQLLARLQEGDSLALVSDAGTPCISDPGYRLVKAAREAGYAVRAVPGPSAAVAALSVSGLPTDRFLFAGFPPRKAAKRREFLRELDREGNTLILYEAPHRVLKTLEDLVEVFGSDRPAFLARELTKLHEEHLAGSLEEIHGALAAVETIKGEITVVVAPAEPGSHRPDWDPADVRDAVGRLRDQGLKTTEAVKQVARIYGVPKSKVYESAIRDAEDSEE